jgi:hypothetical protein
MLLPQQLKLLQFVRNSGRGLEGVWTGYSFLMMGDKNGQPVVTDDVFGEAAFPDIRKG